MARNLSREAHLWYTITSPEYMDRAHKHLQDAFDLLRRCVKANSFISDYPPVPYWGGRMEALLQNYANARALLGNGEYGEMIGWSGQLQDIPRGFEEGNMSWMGSNADPFMEMLGRAYSICSDFNFALTMSQYFADSEIVAGIEDWRVCHPTDDGYSGSSILFCEELVLQAHQDAIPEYQVNNHISCKTGNIVPATGVWIPSRGMGTAALAFARKGIQIMQPAYEILSEDEETGEQEFIVSEVTWNLVQATGRMVSLEQTHTSQEERLRCEAGQPCPQAGYWFTPTKANSRRAFKQGDIMPAVDSAYGATIWHWDADQQN